MSQLESFAIVDKELIAVCKLNEVLYGSKQVPTA